MQTPKLEFKSRVEQFVELTSREWGALEKHLLVKTFKKGEPLIEAGQVEDFMSFVTEGIARIYHLLDGDELTVAFTYENFFACSYNSFTQRTPSRYTVEAIEDMTIVGLDYKSLQSLLDEFKIFERWARLEVERAYFLVEQREISILSYSTKQRFNRLWENSPQLFQRVPQKYLAQYLGMTAETFSRIRKTVEL
ncbi:MAG: CRP-like cAMP-binding protein [Parvicellaceae bacterium]